MSNAPDTASTERFMEELVTLMAPWGWSRTISRVFAYLLVREAPATLDEIVADLGISKGNASMATRELVDYGNAVRLRQPGTKQLLYDAPSAQTGPFIQRAAMLGRMADLLDTQGFSRPAGEAAQRLARQSRFLRSMSEAITSVVSQTENEDATTSR